MTAAPYTRHRSRTPIIETVSVPGPGIAPASTKLYITGSSNGLSGSKYVFTAKISGSMSGDDFWKQFNGITGVGYGRGAYDKSMIALQASVRAFARDVQFPTIPVDIISSMDRRDIIDVVTPGYASLIAKGAIINSPVTNEKYDHKVRYTPGAQPMFSITAKYSSGYMRMSVKRNSAWPTPPDSSQIHTMWEGHEKIVYDSFLDIKQIAINKAFGNINSGAYNYAEEVGEAKETVMYLVSVFNRIGAMFKAVRRGKWKGVVPKTYRRVVKRAKARARRNGTTYQYELSVAMADLSAQAWMELRFAIRPLVYSVNDAIEIYNDGLKVRTGRITSNHAEKGAYGKTTNTVDSVNGNTVETSTTVVAKRKAVGGVLVNADTSTATMRTLGFTNLAGTAWELLFLSWAADYFVDLSGLFYYVTPNIGVTPLAAWASTKDEITISTNVVTKDADGSLVSTVEYSTKTQRYNRHPVERPGYFNLDIDLDIAKSADLAALYYGLSKNLLNKGVIK